MRKDAGSRFIEDNFDPQDRLAIVLIDRRSGAVTQRIATARQIALLEFQVWLRERNRTGADVFVSMNALAEQARGRTRGDVAVIRHLYLDFDENGTLALQHLQRREGIPRPNYLVSTSPDHWQVSWRVQGFGKEQAEETMRNLVREFGADPAATDSARVMRVPGFVNHKRSGYQVRMERLSTEVYSPDRFPNLELDALRVGTHKPSGARCVSRDHLSQSERDWAYARRALSRGDAPDAVVAAIASYRKSDKPDPEYYARMTVKKAALSLEPAPDDDSALER